MTTHAVLIGKMSRIQTSTDAHTYIHAANVYPNNRYTTKGERNDTRAHYTETR